MSQAPDLIEAPDRSRAFMDGRDEPGHDGVRWIGGASFVTRALLISTDNAPP